jgi:UrcA family protein
MNSYIKTDRRTFALGGFLAVALSLFLLPTSAPAAGTDNEVAMAVVKFQDLDVATPAGAAALYWRIHRGANRVCTFDEHSLAPQSAAKQCAQEAEARAVGQLNLSRLTAYFQAKTGKLPATRISMAK